MDSMTASRAIILRQESSHDDISTFLHWPQFRLRRFSSAVTPGIDNRTATSKLVFLVKNSRVSIESCVQIFLTALRRVIFVRSYQAFPGHL